MAAESDPPRGGGESFAWATSSNKDIRTRVSIKQKAVDDALHHALNIRRELRELGDGKLSVGKEIDDWMEEIVKLQEANKRLEILIGVAGRTGAGKTTILNTLLGIPELLPSSNSEAATSCACRVSWNDDDDPNRIFRAEVVFRSPEDVANEIKEIFALIDERDRLDDGDMEGGEAILAWAEVEAEMEHGIAEGLKRIKAILGSKPEVLQLLGTTQIICSGDAEQFSNRIKPYLDASQTSQGFKAWPLITEVKLFVKAPILKHGIVLVDLPGLSDAVESRARVAERYRQKLEITVIVTPARRAIDEKVGVSLVSEHQTVRMQLDNKYHKKGFCVVVSQIDEIDCDVFIKGNPLAKDDENLRNIIQEIDVLTTRSSLTGKELDEKETHLREACKALKDVNVNIKALTPTGPGSRKLRQGRIFQEGFEEAKKKQKAIKKEYSKQEKAVERVKRAKADNDQRLEDLRAQLKWHCIWRRNTHIIEAITRHCAERQKRALARGIPHDHVYDGSVDVIPVCATAFRDYLKDRKLGGFPTPAHTGIPRLRQWLEDATLERREEHLNALLNAFRRLFLVIRPWSNSNCGRQTVQFSREAVQELLSRTHSKFLSELRAELQHGSDKVKSLDPIQRIYMERAACTRTACRIVSRWGKMVPEDKTSKDMMHHTTFDAILRRNGGPYRSGSGEKREYNFPETLAVSFLGDMLKAWHQAFHVDLPSAELPIKQGVERVWYQYIEELEDLIRSTAPDIWPHLGDSIVSRTAPRVFNPEFLSSLREQLEPIFKAALEIRGKQSFKRRQVYLIDAVKGQSEAMFTAGCKKMRKKFARNLAKLPDAFEELAMFAVSKAATQMTLLLDKLAGASDGAWAVAGLEESHQQRLQKTVTEWGMDWQFPKLDGDGFRPEDYEIPRDFEAKAGEVFIKREPGLEDSEGDGQGEQMMVD